MDDIGGRPRSRIRRGLKRYIYAWGDGQADGDGSMRDLLGGKGAGLAEMTYAGLPVPPGFTITTDACNDYFRKPRRIAQRIVGRRPGGHRRSRAIQTGKASGLGRESAARQRTLRREILDARDDGHGPELRPER